MLPYGGGERVYLGKALAELEIRLLAVGLLQQLTLALEDVQDLTLKVIPSHQHGGLGWEPCRCSGQNWEMDSMGRRDRGQRLTFRCTRLTERAFHP